MRSYCRTNNKILFDLADIECHDPNGNICYDDFGDEGMWGGYALDGQHPSGSSQTRLATAMWWLLARIAGWQTEASEIEASADADILGVNATQTVTVTARLYDATNSIYIQNVPTDVTFQLSGPGSLAAPTTVTTSGGIATVVYQAGGTTGTATITATASGLTQDSVSITLFNNSAPTAPTNLLCDGQSNPQGIGDGYPDLTWTFNDNNSGLGDAQRAYQIIIADNATSIDNNEGNVWDSGKIVSDTSLANPGQVPLQSGVTYYWKVRTWDISDAQGSYSSAATFTLASGLGYAVELDPLNGYIDLGNDSSLNLGSTNGLTIEMWVYRLEDDAECVLLDKMGTSGGYCVVIDTGGYLYLRTKGEKDRRVVGTTARVTKGQWHHLACVRVGNGDDGFVYIDGVQAGTNGLLSAPYTVTNSLRLGQAGVIVDELRISEGVRYSSNFTPPTSPFNTDGTTKGLWHFDERTGTSVMDSSGNGNTGTITSPAGWAAGYFGGSGAPDTTPPTPNPSTWATVPYATGSTSISMTATTASDPSGVQYFFDCTAGGGHDSGWQSSSTYQDTGLSPSTQYSYRVQTRDQSANQNTGSWSTTQSATTQSQSDTTPPTPNPSTWATVPYATGSTSISMTATTASDPSGVQYYFDCTTAGGHDSGWQSSSTYQDTGLTASTQYSYRVQTRDQSVNQNTGSWSTTQSATTQAGGGPTTLLSDGFETSFDNWTDGGVTDWDRTTAQKYSGSYSAHCGFQDHALISDNINTTGYSSITIDFWFRDNDIDDNDDAYLQLYDGSEYVNRYELGNSTEDVWNHAVITVNNSGADAAYFISNFRIAFEGTKIDDPEDLWIDDVVITADGGQGDSTPPTPNPLTWATVPYATGTTSISMTATTASDPSGVEYYFDCTAGGGNDSGWQDGTTYEDTGLSPSTQCTYRVQARDKSANQNTGGWSTSESATTDAQADTTPPTPNPLTWTTTPYATGTTSISMTATTASDPSGVEYYFDCTAGGGNDSGWQDSTTYEDTGLSPSTQYTYRVQARDKSANQNTGGWSSSESATTDAQADTTPPTPNPLTWGTAPYATGTTSISMTATTASDPSGVEYYFDCTAGGGNDSGWQDSTAYEDTGLDPNTQYTYRVQARDKSANQNTGGWSSAESATTDPNSQGGLTQVVSDTGFEDNYIPTINVNEVWDGTTIGVWFNYGTNYFGEFEPTTGDTYAGTYKASLDSSVHDGSRLMQVMELPSATVSGEQATFSCWLKGDIDFIDVMFYVNKPPSGNLFSNRDVHFRMTGVESSGWTHKTQNFTPAAAYNWAAFRVVGKNSTYGYCYLDDVTLELELQ